MLLRLLGGGAWRGPSGREGGLKVGSAFSLTVSRPDMDAILPILFRFAFAGGGMSECCWGGVEEAGPCGTSRCASGLDVRGAYSWACARGGPGTMSLGWRVMELGGCFAPGAGEYREALAMGTCGAGGARE